MMCENCAYKSACNELFREGLTDLSCEDVAKYAESAGYRYEEDNDDT